MRYTCNIFNISKDKTNEFLNRIYKKEKLLVKWKDLKCVGCNADLFCGGPHADDLDHISEYFEYSFMVDEYLYTCINCGKFYAACSHCSDNYYYKLVTEDAIAYYKKKFYEEAGGL